MSLSLPTAQVGDASRWWWKSLLAFTSSQPNAPVSSSQVRAPQLTFYSLPLSPKQPYLVVGGVFSRVFALANARSEQTIKANNGEKPEVPSTVKISTYLAWGFVDKQTEYKTFFPHLKS